MKKLFTLFAVAALAFAAQANVLSVCQGEYYSSTVPVYGLWYDTPGQTQQIYPADMLAEMAGGEISEISFLTLSNLDGSPYGQDFSSYTIKMSEGLVALALMEVDEIGFTEAVAITGAEVVATTVPEYGSPKLTFVLDEPFAYNGGNLLVEVTVTEPGEYGGTYFWGAGFYDENDNPIYTPTYTANENYSGDVTTNLAAFLAAADFTYEVSEEPGPDPEDPHATGQWLVLFDKDGNEVFVELVPGEGVQVALEYGIYGGYNAEEDPNNPMVPYYFLVDGVRYGAEEADAETHMGAMDQTLLNPLTEGEDNYVIPTGYNYLIGIYTDGEGNMFVMCAQAGWVGVNELMNGKTVAGVRYFNMAGQEMQQAEGLTIVVTTYTDGSSSAVKVMK